MNKTPYLAKSLDLAYLCHFAFLTDDDERVRRERVFENTPFQEKDTVMDRYERIVVKNRQERLSNKVTVIERQKALSVGFSIRLKGAATTDLVLEMVEENDLVRIKEFSFIRDEVDGRFKTAIMLGASVTGGGEKTSSRFTIEFDYDDQSFWERLLKTTASFLDTGYLDKESHRLILCLQSLIQQHG